MNNCVLMAEIIQEPQLRYTADNLEIAEMLVQFSALRDGEPPATLKVVGWGNLAKEIQQNYHSGDRVIIEGRLGMNTIEREGFKEKRAELTVQKIHSLGSGNNNASPTVSRTSSEPVASSQKAVDRYETPLKTPPPATSNVSVFAQDEPESEYVPRHKFEPSSYPAVVPSEEPPDDIPF